MRVRSKKASCRTDSNTGRISAHEYGLHLPSSGMNGCWNKLCSILGTRLQPNLSSLSASPVSSAMLLVCTITSCETGDPHWISSFCPLELKTANPLSSFPLFENLPRYFTESPNSLVPSGLRLLFLPLTLTLLAPSIHQPTLQIVYLFLS